jgi:hypothetical protein
MSDGARRGSAGTLPADGGVSKAQKIHAGEIGVQPAITAKGARGAKGAKGAKEGRGKHCFCNREKRERPRKKTDWFDFCPGFSRPFAPFAVDFNGSFFIATKSHKNQSAY